MKHTIAICAGVLASSLALGIAGTQPATAQLVYPGYPAYPAYPGYAVIAPPEVTAIVQSNGLKPLTPPMRYGPSYMLRALDPNGQEVRVVLNARSGRIIAVRPTFGPRYAEAHYNIGVCYYELHQTEEAATWYRAAIKARHGRYPAALFALGVALEDLGMREKGKAAFKDAIEASGGRHAGALFRFGLALHREGDYEAAMVHYRRALAHNNSPFPACHNNLGVVLAINGRLSEAESEFDTALTQSKGRFEDARLNLELCRSLTVSKSRAYIAKLRTTGGVIESQGQ